MSGSDQEDRLSGTRQVILVLRLVLDPRAELNHGELLDAQAIQQGRFVTEQGMLDSLSHWLARQQPADTRDADQAMSGK